GWGLALSGPPPQNRLSSLIHTHFACYFFFFFPYQEYGAKSKPRPFINISILNPILLQKPPTTTTSTMAPSTYTWLTVSLLILFLHVAPTAAVHDCDLTCGPRGLCFEVNSCCRIHGYKGGKCENGYAICTRENQFEYLSKLCNGDSINFVLDGCILRQCFWRPLFHYIRDKTKEPGRKTMAKFVVAISVVFTFLAVRPCNVLCEQGHTDRVSICCRAHGHDSGYCTENKGKDWRWSVFDGWVLTVYRARRRHFVDYQERTSFTLPAFCLVERLVLVESKLYGLFHGVSSTISS
ncbi:hypothetical protein L249_3793, partial [Ophiocordyceps polyrhachis-furcata BCC 54312]